MLQRRVPALPRARCVKHCCGPAARHTVQHAMRNTQHAARSMRHATRNTQCATCITQHATRNTRHATRDTRHATRNTQHATCNTQHAACNTRHATGDMQHASARRLQEQAAARSTDGGQAQRSEAGDHLDGNGHVAECRGEEAVVPDVGTHVDHGLHSESTASQQCARGRPVGARAP